MQFSDVKLKQNSYFYQQTIKWKTKNKDKNLEEIFQNITINPKVAEHLNPKNQLLSTPNPSPIPN